MNLLLDTHILLWALSNDAKLSDKARKLITDRNNHIFYSVLSLWEIELKAAGHPNEFPVNSESIYNYCCSSDYRQLSLKSGAVFMLPSLIRSEGAPKHKDPFDKMLLCQSESENMNFITHDEKLADYNIGNVILV